MANINTYLNQILSATYGEEVRGAIHDSINAMNLESTEAIDKAETAQDSATVKAAEAATKAEEATTGAALATTKAEEAAASEATAATAAAIATTKAEEAAASATAASEDASTASQAAANAEASDESVAAKVADVMTMKTNLMAYHAIYQELMDNNGEIILDSTEGSLVGQVLYSDAQDIISLKKYVSDLERVVNRLASFWLDRRLTSVENMLIESNTAITRLNDHALLDSDY